MYRILPHFSATALQVSTYLGGIALFSISFLVFINASISFVITDVVGQKSDVGNAVGTLGFADELVALVACPLWGLVSDRVGVRWVAVAGYCVIGFSLICLVQSDHVYPDLVLWRMVFSIGGAACTTMVTAMLPTMTASDDDKPSDQEDPDRVDFPRNDVAGNNRNSFAPSEASDMTITPGRYQSQRSRDTSPLLSRFLRTRRPAPEQQRPHDERDPHIDSSRLAGFVGMFTGIGALLALVAFLPLPTVLGKNVSKALAVQRSFYIVGTVAFVVAILVSLGLRHLPGESHKSIKHIFRYSAPDSAKSVSPEGQQPPTYLNLLKAAILLGVTDSNVSLGYIGGFVARSSSVGISSFIPLFVNAYFIRTGQCESDPSSVLRDSCSRAYTLSSMLTGISQLVALLAAPLYGLAAARLARHELASRVPLALAAAAGIAGSLLFGTLRSPDPQSPQGRVTIMAVVLLGAAQIGTIVCSLSLLARGIHSAGATPTDADASPLLARPGVDRTGLKGSIAGVYSLAGGAAILVLTKLGGKMSDTVAPGAPFYLLAGFNGVLLVAVVLVAGGQALRRKGTRERQDVEDVE